jgi:hypothetical protein
MEPEGSSPYSQEPTPPVPILSQIDQSMPPIQPLEYPFSYYPPIYAKIKICNKLCMWACNICGNRFREWYLGHLLPIASCQRIKILSVFCRSVQCSCEAWVCHCGVVEGTSLLGCNAVLLGKLFPVHRRLLERWDEGTKIFWNVTNNSSSDIASYPRILSSAVSLSHFEQKGNVCN